MAQVTPDLFWIINKRLKTGCAGETGMAIPLLPYEKDEAKKQSPPPKKKTEKNTGRPNYHTHNSKSKPRFQNKNLHLSEVSDLHSIIIKIGIKLTNIKIPEIHKKRRKFEYLYNLLERKTSSWRLNSECYIWSKSNPEAVRWSAKRRENSKTQPSQLRRCKIQQQKLDILNGENSHSRQSDWAKNCPKR